MTLKNKPFDKNFYHIKRFTLLIYYQTLLATAWILLIPTGAERAIFLGYSLRRLALLIPVIGLAFGAFLFSFMLKRNLKVSNWMTNSEKLAALSRGIILTGALLSGAMLALFVFYHYLLWFPDVGAFYRLMPLMVLFFLTGIEMILFVPLALFRKKKADKPRINSVWRSSVLWIVLALLLLVSTLIEFSNIGKQPVRVSIITLGVPLLEGQVWFTAGSLVIILLSAMAWSFIPRSSQQKPQKNFDLVVFILIWLSAFAFWMYFPLPEHNYFAPAVRPPTFAKYPFSDAEQYDFNSLYVLFGALDNFVVSKSLYVSFLAIIHFLVGFDYGAVILLQTAVMALLPAVGYLIGKELHSRLSGGGLALLLILREANAILASTMANVSNSKLLMSDVPATLIIAVMILVIIRWCKAGKNRVTHHVFLLGGLTAMLNLIRIQTMVFVPFILVLIIIRYFTKWKQILLAMGIFLLTVSLMLAPILVRNQSITGVYWLDNVSSSGGLHRFFTKGSNVEIEIPDVEDNSELVSRNFSVILSIILQDFGTIFYFMLENFSRNLISTFLIFPIRVGNGIPFEDMLRMVSPFFTEVYSVPGWANATIIFANIVIIAIGLSSLLRRKPLATTMVVLVYLAYNASSSVVRLSGWRFIQTVDWIVMVFFVVGLIEIIDALIRAFWRRDYSYRMEIEEKQVQHTPKLVFKLLSAATFFLLCAFIPLRERLLPPTYPPYDPQAICTEIRDIVEADQTTQIPAQDVYDFCLADSTRVLKGYGFYPRFFKAYDGYYSRAYDPFFGRQDYARLVFRLVGGRNGKIYIKTDKSDMQFQDGNLVYALVYDRSKADAQLVIVAGEDPLVIFSDPILQGAEAWTDLR
jgi:hypothetical protein